MTDRNTQTSQRKAAIVAGLGLLLMMVLAIFANFVVLEGLVVPGDATATARNIAANEPQFRAGIACLASVAVLDVVVAWALYVFLIQVNKNLSLLTAWFRLAYATILVVALGSLLETCTQKVGPSACVKKLTSSRSCAMMDTTNRGGQYGKAVFAQAQVPDCDGGAER
jgi:hypothetical protein